MIKMNYHQSHRDHILCIKHNSSVKFTTLIINMDAIIVTQNSEGGIQRIIAYLSNEFEIKDLGSLKYFLKIEETLKRKNIYFPTKYVLDFFVEHKDARM